jgi:NAD+ kinase
MQQIGIIYRDDHPEARILATALRSQLIHRDIKAWDMPASALRHKIVDTQGTDLALVLGGDGTILSAARICALTDTPILGINFGHVGFLAELQPGEVFEQIPFYLRGDNWVDERAMLNATLDIDDQHEDFLALNDVVVVRGAHPRVIRFKLWIDSYYYSTMTADGVIISTATGSTAYNLSAGGPILHPSVRGSVLTPVASHLVVDRPIVLEQHSVVRLELLEGSASAILSADGQINRSFDGAAVVTITTSPYVTRFLRRRPRSHFYHVLSDKLSDRSY